MSSYRFIVESSFQDHDVLLGVIELGYYEPQNTGGHPDTWEPCDWEPHCYDILSDGVVLNADVPQKEIEKHLAAIDKALRQGH